ncbi:MAG: MFS transporter [Mediterranea sp.]|nr:MFS transporter [Mediterranea sp.]
MNQVSSLWTSSFKRFCFSNYLMFLSWYMLLPVLPSVMIERLELYSFSGGIICLLLTGAMLVLGPFYNYWVDIYKRKYMYMLSLIVIISILFCYNIINNEAELWMLCLAQGMAFGVGTTGIFTLSIDLTVSTQRSAGNMIFSWLARLGMLSGIALGTVLYLQYNFETVILFAAIAEIISLFNILTTYVPFRAPIGVRICSFDRFLLLRGWLPMLNLIFVAVVPGLLIIPSVNDVEIYSFMTYEVMIPYFAVAGMFFLLSICFIRFAWKDKTEVYAQTLVGLMMLFTAMLLPLFFVSNVLVLFISFALLGSGLGFVTPKFLIMFAMLSKHCQRGTGNMTHLLGWEIGISLGIAISYYFVINSLSETIFLAGLMFSALALFLFMWGTYPYLKKKKVR